MIANRDRCVRMIDDIKSGDYYGTKFIKKHKLTVSEFRVVEDMVTDLLRKGESGCFQEKVAKVFEKYGFTVSPDEHNVMFYVYLT